MTTLKEVLEKLNPNHFAQTHKTYIVNLDKVAKVSPMFSGNYEILLKDAAGTKIPLSRRQAKRLKNLLEIW